MSGSPWPWDGRRLCLAIAEDPIEEGYQCSTEVGPGEITCARHREPRAWIAYGPIGRVAPDQEQAAFERFGWRP